MYGGKDLSSSISRRTRSQDVLYFRKAHEGLRKKRHQEISSGTGNDNVASCNVNANGHKQDFVNLKKYEKAAKEVVLSSDDDSDDSAEFVPLDDAEQSSEEVEDEDNDDVFGSDEDEDEDYNSNTLKKSQKAAETGGKQKPGMPLKVYEISSNSEEDIIEEYELRRSKKMRKPVETCERRKPGKPSKKTASQRSKIDKIEILVESIWKQNEEWPVMVEKKAPNPTPLPLKFRFEDDECPSVPEKTDQEKEIETLFRELEIALWRSEARSSSSSMNNGEDSNSDKVNAKTTCGCGGGEYDVVLDEQIGVRCKCCSDVLLDIREVLPSFFVESPERRERKYPKESRNSNANEFQFKESACDNDSSTNFNSSIDSKGTVLDLIPNSEKKELYSHQLEGFEFMWKNIAGDIHMKNLKNLPCNQGGGCIISHAPGTGKTRLSIVFLQTYLKLYPNCHPVIIAPRGMLMTWEQEFQKWKVGIKFLNLNEDKLNLMEAEAAATALGLKWGQEKGKDYIRFVKLYSWMKGGSILGVSYRLFERLAGESKKKGSNEKMRRILLEIPGLLFLDEGHTPRNSQSLIWNALTNVKSQRRVILSGTPFQNNFVELCNTLSLVNPKFSGEIKKNPGRKRKNEGWDYLTNSIINKKCKAEEEQVKKLRLMIEPFVHVHKGGILQKTLPGMKDCLILLRPTDLQRELLQSITQVEQYLDQSYLASLISIHPSLAAEPALIAKNPSFSNYKNKLQEKEHDPRAGVKTLFLIELIKLSTRLREKVLVFSQYIDPLLHIKKLLKSQFEWNEGHEVIYMDGDLSLKQRQCSINSFNDKSGKAKVLLASQRACSEGISLVGASRVVLLDVVWNPSVERQAISRAYRIGQERVVYVYHLVTSMEVKKFEKQAEKERISELIFPAGNGGERREENVDVEEDKVLEAMVRHESLCGIFERIVHQPKESDLVDTFGFLD